MADRTATSFFRKVVRFVANPATDWADLDTRQEDTRELELEKSELKEMIERKRRNDFVRKREFDMLRKVRREGLSPEQLAALGGSSRLDDSEARCRQPQRAADGGVKAKIDEIEQQMVGDGVYAAPAREAVGFFRRAHRAGGAGARQPAGGAGALRPAAAAHRPASRRWRRPDLDAVPALPPLPDLDNRARVDLEHARSAAGADVAGPVAAGAAVAGRDRRYRRLRAPRSRSRSARSCTTPNSTRP